jgi:peptidyl-prolyl cis-trans isomerase SurA
VGIGSSFPSATATAFRVGLVALLLADCSPKQQESVVATVGDEKITLTDYDKMYTKSNATAPSAASVTQEEREKFLELMIKYKLKLKDAYRQGLDRDPQLLAEIAQYKGSLAQSFLTEREVVVPGVRRLYDRRTEEIQTSHILLELAPGASRADSAAAYTLAYDIIAQLKAGANFEDLAAKHSKDPSVSTNRGDLYYATGGDFVEPFETAVYALKVGEVGSNPVQTRFGLHVIKVVNRKPSPGQVRASHIMARFNSMTPTPEDTAAAFAKISRVRDSLAMGISFADLAIRNSDDGGSAPRGGDLGWFARRRWIRPFDDTVMVLPVGQVSSIVRTSYGYHLIECTGRQPVKPFPEVKSEMEQLYQQRRFQDDLADYMSRLKKDLVYSPSPTVIARLAAALDSTKSTRDTAWAAGVDPALATSTLLHIQGQPVRVDSFLALLQSRPDLNGQRLRAETVYSAVDKVGEQLLFAAKADQLARSNPEFQAILKDYREGILLYQVEQQRVWGNISPTDSLLRAYFDGHRERFVFPDRVRFSEIRFTSAPAAAAAREQLLGGMTMEQIVAQDSTRMKQISSFTAGFPRRTTSLSAAARKTLDSVALQMKSDPGISVRFSAWPDTSSPKQKARNLQTAQRQIEAMKKYLTGNHRIQNESILVRLEAQPADSVSRTERTRRAERLGIDIIGRQPRIVGGLDHQLLAPAADDRAKQADSLSLGEVSHPFFHKNGHALVRLEGREPSRQKSYAEAGPEVSTAFQDYEAKRLEQEWILGLRKDFPVMERKDVLQSAYTKAP